MIDKRSYKLLKKFYRKKRLSFADVQAYTEHDEGKRPSEYISVLYSNHFIKHWLSEDLIEVGGLKEHRALGYEITLAGQAFVEQRRRETRNFWVPYSITTFIALFSLLETLLWR